MKIPDEVAVAAMTAPDTWEFIAVWARKEALEEALAAVDAIEVRVVGPDAAMYEAGIEWAADAIRDLAEGDN